MEGEVETWISSSPPLPVQQWWGEINSRLIYTMKKGVMFLNFFTILGHLSLLSRSLSDFVMLHAASMTITRVGIHQPQPSGWDLSRGPDMALKADFERAALLAAACSFFLASGSCNRISVDRLSPRCSKSEINSFGNLSQKKRKLFSSRWT